MRRYIKLFFDNKCKNNKKFELVDLEKFIIEKCGGQSNYYELGGYEAFYKEMQKLKEEKIIREIARSESNRAKLPMKLKWTIVTSKVESSWKDEDIIKYSDMLNFKTYIKHPEYQTKKEWMYIKNIYNFLKERENRKWDSVEERCLELFYDEKFLTDSDNGKKDNKVLKRLSLSLEDIKAKQYGEQFIYWNRGVSEIKTLIILENHSTFFSFKRAVQKGIKVFGIAPDALIFGYGKKIIKSFSFLDEIAKPSEVTVYYFGDMDPDGYFIYKALKDKYNDVNISLLVQAYVELIKVHKKYKSKNQQKNEECLKCILKEFEEKNYDRYKDYVVELWKENCRIPQEFITYEYLLEMEGGI
ncbi:Wadjet anti-phage system protein JetD domain-containing protein [Clostridium guangxiense]|uniref:Wadjet anti-phage system protein JetD domain-containing protein n=1 Tax=Clostridium guangxiense TaxID=1662055 RepID=UPI001E5B250D|nr:Wadjet anti-phage system protein JetD domain-containing protein [Clostridium guangxiense]MCD2345660.1 DUF2220 domain-containing protein [Clostridium guangxiense]